MILEPEILQSYREQFEEYFEQEDFENAVLAAQIWLRKTHTSHIENLINRISVWNQLVD